MRNLLCRDILYLEEIKTSTLFLLSGKLCMLFLLLTGQRYQTLHWINIKGIKGGYLDFSHLIEKRIYISLKFI